MKKTDLEKLPDKTQRARRKWHRLSDEFIADRDNADQLELIRAYLRYKRLVGRLEEAMKNGEVRAYNEVRKELGLDKED